ncbi:MAG: hypothetical protein ACRC4L_02780 [Mycoplasma sp.]
MTNIKATKTMSNFPDYKDGKRRIVISRKNYDEVTIVNDYGEKLVRNIKRH